MDNELTLRLMNFLSHILSYNIKLLDLLAI